MFESSKVFTASTPLLQKLPVPGLFITATDTEVGKTIITAAIARVLHLQGLRVGVCKPVASGCVHRREGLVSEDAELLAAGAESRHPLDLICPQRFAEPLAPAIAADRAKQPLDWGTINHALQYMSREVDVMLVEGVGGVRAPMDRQHTVIDMARWLGLPAVIVARPNLGTINHTLLTADCLRAAGVPIAGVVINRYLTDRASIAEEANPRAIERWGKVKILCIAPEVGKLSGPHPHPDILAMVQTVDWQGLCNRG